MIETNPFGVDAAGNTLLLFHCENSNGLVLRVTNFGAIVVSLETPDRNGKLANINLGFPDFSGYELRHPYFGSTVGRYGNRIAQGRFQIDGDVFQLATNDAPHHLHGGVAGFDRATWQAEPFESADEVGVRFGHTSPDGDEGFPGALDVEAVYSLTPDNRLRVVFTATTNKPTHVNLTNHNYWNLAGVSPGDAAPVLEHVLELEADQYVPVNETLIPTGELADVEGTPLDFRSAKPIGQDLHAIEAVPVGYDHCYVVRGEAGVLRRAAKVHEPSSGRSMEVFTNQPGIQLYTGNFLDGTEVCGGFKQHCALCLETQHYPDTPNQPTFPSTLLAPGETYHHVTEHLFAVE